MGETVARAWYQHADTLRYWPVTATVPQARSVPLPEPSPA